MQQGGFIFSPLPADGTDQDATEDGVDGYQRSSFHEMREGRQALAANALFGATHHDPEGVAREGFIVTDRVGTAYGVIPD